MTFSGEDPVAIHSVIAAATRIVRDICEKRGDIESYLSFTDWIADGHERDFWNRFNASANFIKHADKDPDSIHEFNDEESDFLIMFTAKWFRDLGNSVSKEMRIFAAWWGIQNSEIYNKEIMSKFANPDMVQKMKAMQDAMKPLSRADRLKAGMMMLKA